MTLYGLIAPLTTKSFFTDYWRRKPLYVQRSPGFVEQFPQISLSRLPAVDPHNVRILRFKNGTVEQAVVKDWRDIPTAYKNGFSVTINRVHLTDERFRALCGAFLHSFPGYAVCRANVYLTPPNAQAIAPHRDMQEVFAVQLSGEKHWVLDSAEYDLRAGDILYIPMGHRHAVVSTASESVSISIQLLTRWDQIKYGTIKFVANRGFPIKSSLPY